MKKNIVARILLFPFSLLYAGIISLRNIFYETGVLRSTSFNIPVVNVGNLSIGGTGKTPHIEYLIKLLSPYLNIATLSRGYKRKTKGFRLANHNDNAQTLGDEPYQFFIKHNNIKVAVSESRDIGIPMIIQKHPHTQTILLDDAFQHRSVTPGLNILLTEYNNLFTDDYLLPAGRLREPRDAYRRADLIVVTKCPTELSQDEMDRVIKKIKPLDHQSIHFSKYKYLNPYYIFDQNITVPLESQHRIVLISAIANVDYLLQYLEDTCTVDNVIKYEDHHYFTDFELEQFKKMYENLTEENSLFLTTEKDAMRLLLHKEFLMKHNIPIFVLPIDVEFMHGTGQRFDNEVKQFLLDFKS